MTQRGTTPTEHATEGAAPSFEDYGGNAPENYERYFVPAIGAPLAVELVKAAAPGPGERVLDVACGTGIVARLAAERLAGTASVTGLDPNPGMLAVARALTPTGTAIDWVESPAEATPLPGESFDVALCQMGLQFFTDRPAALRELHRVLAPGGRLIATVPGPAPQLFAVLEEAIAEHVSSDAAGFVAVVFSLHDPVELHGLLEGAGFTEVDVERRCDPVTLPPPAEWLWQYVWSTPLSAAVAAIDEHDRAALEREVVSRWEELAGDGAMRGEVELSVASCRK